VCKEGKVRGGKKIPFNIMRRRHEEAEYRPLSSEEEEDDDLEEEIRKSYVESKRRNSRTRGFSSSLKGSVSSRKRKNQLQKRGKQLKKKITSIRGPTVIPDKIESPFVDIKKTRKRFDLLLVDLPFCYEKGPNATTKVSKGNFMKGFSANSQYNTMTLKQMMRLGRTVKKISKKDCVLLFWVPTTHLEDAFKIINAWGFKYINEFMVWHKTGPGGWGRYVRICHETLLLAGKGEMENCVQYFPPIRVVNGVPFMGESVRLLLARKGRIYPLRDGRTTLSNNVIVTKRDDGPEDEPREYRNVQHSMIEQNRGRHSQKPFDVYNVIYDTFPNCFAAGGGRSLEFPARNAAPGFHVSGNDPSIQPKSRKEDVVYDMRGRGERRMSFSSNEIDERFQERQRMLIMKPPSLEPNVDFYQMERLGVPNLPWDYGE